jgi:hypothetical protein
MSGPDLADFGSPEERLLAAARLYREANDRSDLRLEALLHSVGAVLSLLRRDHDPAALAPQQYLFAALSRLAAGQSDPALRPLRGNSKGGRPPPDGAIKYKQVNVLLAVELLLRAGWKPKRTYQRVAEMASAAGLSSADGKPITQNVVRNWRHALSTDPHMDDVKKLVGARAATLLDEPESSAAEDAAEQMLIAAANGFEGVEISTPPIPR